MKTLKVKDAMEVDNNSQEKTVDEVQVLLNNMLEEEAAKQLAEEDAVIPIL